MAKRHGFWTFTGERSADGRPKRFFHGIPARDLTGRDIDRLDDDQYAAVVESDLYEKADPPKAEKGDAKKADAPADGKVG